MFAIRTGGHAYPMSHRDVTEHRPALNRPFDLRDWGRIGAIALLAVGLGTLVASPPVVLAIVFVIAMTRRGQRLLFGARLTSHAPRHTQIERRSTRLSHRMLARPSVGDELQVRRCAVTAGPPCWGAPPCTGSVGSLRTRAP